MGPVDLNDDAQAPNPTAHPQHRRNHSPETPVHGNRLGPPIKRAPELNLVHASSPLRTSATPGHSEDLEEVSSPNSGRPDLPRPPPRFAPVRPSPAPKPRPLPHSSYQKPNPLFNLISAALSDESLDHQSRRPPEQSSPSTWYSPATTTTTNRRRREP